MTAQITSSSMPSVVRNGLKRKFRVGTTGWSADDLDRPEIERQWDRGRYEIVEGVLTRMPPAFYDGTLPLANLRRLIERHLDRNGLPGIFTHEDDFIVGQLRVARVDMVFMTPEDQRRQMEAHARRARPQLRFGRLVVPPTLVVESVSVGHEAHDEETKRQWYAQARVPNYWLLNAYRHSLECLVLEGDRYRVDQSGRDDELVNPSLFPGLTIPLSELWKF